MNIKRILINFVVGILIFSLGIGVGYIIPHPKNNDDVLVNQHAETTEEPSKEPPQNDGEKDNSLIPLKEKLQEEMKDYEGEWSLYIENLATGEKIEINNKKMRSASLIKLFIMGAVYEEIESGSIKKEDVSSYLKEMITVSDNEASNVLVSMLGGGKYNGMDEVFNNGLKKINTFAKNLDCKDTEQQRDMKASREKPIPQENYTSAKDCGILLGRLYRKEFISPDADEEMIRLLKGQERRAKIPAGLPPEIVCANKTGELSDTENDVAIVYSPGADYIICILSNDLKDTSVARNNIAKISEMTYNFFNAKQ